MISFDVVKPADNPRRSQYSKKYPYATLHGLLIDLRGNGCLVFDVALQAVLPLYRMRRSRRVAVVIVRTETRQKGE